MKTILSIDGGGIRGLIPGLILSHIENQTKRPISDCFDLIAGTSTGGILALGLSKDNGNGKPQFSAKELCKIYETRGHEIFPRSLWRGVSSVGGLTDEKYSHKGLESVLEEYFGNQTVSSSLTNVVITSYDIENRTPLFIKSWREQFEDIEMRHAARATSAAPTYFEPALVNINGKNHSLIDGGVFINSPAMSAYAEAKRVFPNEKKFALVSLGTGELNRPIPIDEAKAWGKIGWLAPLIGCIFDGVSDATDYQLNQILGNQYFRFQAELINASDDLDDVTNRNINGLKSEAKKVIRTHKDELIKVCDLLSDQ
ncbi:MAG: CBASS cGAMP-activated phospholipase [Gammaproteobacteria bacterium]|nr:CBASS cGAMP-activated phospholipase [Gammaproteobacteria bacterium]